jgi:predicted DNA-binding transcriptional regulator YafY
MHARKKSKTSKGKRSQTLAAGRAKSKTKKNKAPGIAANLPDDGGVKYDFGSPDDRFGEVFAILKEASLHGRVVTMGKLIGSVGVCRRQIQRYFKRLEAKPYYLQVTYDLSRQGHYISNVKSGDFLPLGSSLSHRHKIAIEVARQALAVFEGSNFANLIGESLKKILGRDIRPQQLGLGIPIEKLVSFRTPGAGIANAEVFNAITDCLLGNNVLEIHYKSRASGGDPQKLFLEPLHLACVADRWVLVARDRRRKEDKQPIRTYIISRFSQPLIATSIPFTYPDNFDPTHYVQSSFGVHSGPCNAKPILVKLRISKEGAHHVLERRWHPTQKVTNITEGMVEVEFMVSHTGDIIRWILSFGSDIEVLSPKQLRDEIQKEATLMLVNYNREISDPI